MIAEKREKKTGSTYQTSKKAEACSDIKGCQTNDYSLERKEGDEK